MTLSRRSLPFLGADVFTGKMVKGRERSGNIPG